MFGRQLLKVIGPVGEQLFTMMVIHSIISLVFQASPRLLSMEMKKTFDTNSMLWFYYGNNCWMNPMCIVSFLWYDVL